MSRSRASILPSRRCATIPIGKDEQAADEERVSDVPQNEVGADRADQSSRKEYARHARHTPLLVRLMLHLVDHGVEGRNSVKEICAHGRSNDGDGLDDDH